MKLPTADRADRAAAALVRKPNGVFRVHYENGYPQAIMLGKVVVIHLVEGDLRTMACVEPLVELLNGFVWMACPFCGRKNRWKWAKEEIAPGWIKLTCDHCEKETNTVLWWKDRADAIAWVEEA